MSGGSHATGRSSILISVQGPVAIAYGMGTLDRAALRDLCDRMRLLAFDGVRGLVCSLERVTHVHYQAMEALLDVHRMMHESGGEMVLAGASPYVRQILDFGGVPRRIPLLPDKATAVEELRARPGDATGAWRSSGASVQQSFF